MSDIVHVAVAVILNDNDEVCISLRHKDAHQGGLWEFPGGKIEVDESVEQALIREIREELNLTVLSSRPLITISHQYQDKQVCLHVHRVLSFQGQVEGLLVGVENQPVKWVSVTELSSYDFPAANSPIIKALLLPERYLITGKFLDVEDFVKKLRTALDNKIKLVQLRLKEGAFRDLEQAQELVTYAAELCQQAGAKLMLNIPDTCLANIDKSKINYSGIHADSRTLKTLSQRPDGDLFSASCHNTSELQKAMSLKTDFVLLSPVQKTASHPEMAALGWHQFSTMIEAVNIPVFALGGVSPGDIKTAHQFGAQGIAAISALWEPSQT